MTVNTFSIKHAFVSPIADDPNAASLGEVLPSHWNANHTITGTVSVFGPVGQLSSDQQYYVSNSGSDSNSGTSPGQPWATIQHAFDTISTIDLNGFVVFINLAPGTYAGATAGNLYSSKAGALNATAQGGYVQIVGDNVTPSNCVITTNSAGTGCFYGFGAVYGLFQGIFITGVRLNASTGVCIGADPAVFAGVGDAHARFILGTNDSLFNGLIEIAGCGNHSSIFAGDVTDNGTNGGIFTVNILANLISTTPKAIFTSFTGIHVTLVQADYFIIGGTLTLQNGLVNATDIDTGIFCFPSIFRNGAGGSYIGKQYNINGANTTSLVCAGPLSGFSIGSAGSLNAGYIQDSNNTQILQIPGAAGYSAQTTKTGNYSAAIGDRALVFNGSGSITLTLLPPGTWPGLEILVKTIAAQTVVSASANVISLDGSTTSTAILSATAGKWALLKSNGTNWEIMASN